MNNPKNPKFPVQKPKSTSIAAKTPIAGPKIMRGPSIGFGSKIQAKLSDPEAPLILRVFSKAGKLFGENIIVLIFMNLGRSRIETKEGATYS